MAENVARAEWHAPSTRRELFRHEERMAVMCPQTLVYSAKNPLKRYLHNARRRTILSLVTEDLSLDLGCGDGLILNDLKNAVGVDLAPTRIKRARSYTTHPLIICDGECLPLRRSIFDCVILSEVLEHVLDPKECVGEVEEILRDDGSIVISIPNEMILRLLSRRLLNPFHWNIIKEDDLRKILSLILRKNVPMNLPFFLSVFHVGLYRKHYDEG